MNLAIENKKVINLWFFFCQKKRKKKKKKHYKEAKQGFWVCLGFPYFTKIENFY